MAASIKTVVSVARILIEEVGFDKALRIAERLRRETDGNRSYNTTINILYAALRDWKEKQ
jgi:hypothetical protein